MTVNRRAIVYLNCLSLDIAVHDCLLADSNIFPHINLALYRAVDHQILRLDIPKNDRVFTHSCPLCTLNLSCDKRILGIEVMRFDISCDIPGDIHPAVRQDVPVHHPVHLKSAFNRNISIYDSSLRNDCCLNAVCFC